MNKYIFNTYIINFNIHKMELILKIINSIVITKKINNVESFNFNKLQLQLYLTEFQNMHH